MYCWNNCKKIAQVFYIIYLMNKSDNPRIIKNGTSSSYMNICINRNGDLEVFSEFNNLKEVLDELLKNFENQFFLKLLP